MSTEITVVTIPNPLEVFTKPGGLDAIIGKIEAEARSIVSDISTESGRDNIRSLAAKLAKSKTALDKMGKDLTEEQRKQIAVVNAERSKAWDRLENLQKEIRQPLTDWENAEKKRVFSHEEELSKIKALSEGLADMTASNLILRLDSLEGFEQREWQEFAARAVDQLYIAKDTLEKALSARQKADADALELARLRAAEDQRLKVEAANAAAAHAKAEAERLAKVEADRIAAQVKAESDAAAKREADALALAEKEKAARIEAEQKAEADKQAAVNAERARLLKEQEDERKAAAAKAEEEKKAKAAREADHAHKAKIHNEALHNLLSVIFSDDPAVLNEFQRCTGQEVVKAIARGEIPNVKFVY